MPRWLHKLQGPFMHYDVLVVGDSAWDTIVRVPQAIIYDGDQLAQIYQGAGGQGLNMAVAAVRQGATTGLVTQVGLDAQSRRLVRQMRSLGIQLPGLARVDPLTRVVSVVRADGERALLTDPGVGPLSQPHRQLRAKVLLLSGYMLGRPQGCARLQSWLTWARAHQVTVLLDVSHPRLSSSVSPYLASVDWILANQREWEALGRPDWVRSVIKRGQDGLQMRWAGQCIDARAITSAEIVDTTGAGDAVGGGFAAWLARGASPEVALQKAAELGLTTCLHMGAVTLV
jgi:ribokinase